MSALLPVYQGGGSDTPRFRALRFAEESIAKEVELMTMAELRRMPLLSSNAKTSVSLDFPIGHTCDPTALCASVCYASRPGSPTMWRKSLKSRLRNLRYFRLEPPWLSAARLTREFRNKQARWEGRVHLDFLRINGTGDLFPEIIEPLNLFAEHNPDVSLWVVSRLPDLARHLKPWPNLFLQISTDSTTTYEAKIKTNLVIDYNPRAYASFLRVNGHDDTGGAAIVFNEKRTDGLPYDGIRDCPVDAGRLGFDNIRGVGGTACSKCRKCFSEKTIDRQRSP